MVFQKLNQKIAHLRRVEIWSRFVWGFLRLLAVIMIVLICASMIDYIIDRYVDTPWGVRLFLFAGQIVLAIVLLNQWIIEPLRCGLSNDDLALKVEQHYPQLAHRLITVLQLGSRNADMRGVSISLFQEVVKETDEKTAELSFADVVDHRRLYWGLGCIIPVLLLCLTLYLLAPVMTSDLLQRQLLIDVPITRSLQIAYAGDDVFAKGEKLTLRFKVESNYGDVDLDELQGVVYLYRSGKYFASLALIPDITAQAGEGIFVAAYEKTAPDQPWETEIDDLQEDFTCLARLGDGRMRNQVPIKLVNRPVVTKIDSWLILPEYCGLDSETGKRFELYQPQQDIYGIQRSGAKIRITTAEVISGGKIRCYNDGAITSDSLNVASVICSGMTDRVGPASMILARTTGDYLQKELATMIGERFSHDIDLNIDESKMGGEAIIDNIDGITSFSVVVYADFAGASRNYRFFNMPPPKRNITINEEDAPQVALLPEAFTPSEQILPTSDSDPVRFDGMPIPPGGKIRIAYRCFGKYGLGSANLRFRVLRDKDRGDSAFQSQGQQRWYTLPLPLNKASKDLGGFRPESGKFEKSTEDHQIYFYSTPTMIPGEKIGGGRFDLDTTKLPGISEELASLEVGDQLEFYIEVSPSEKTNSFRPLGKSEIRTKNVVSIGEFLRWLDDTLQEEQRIRSLENKQRSVFPAN